MNRVRLGHRFRIGLRKPICNTSEVGTPDTDADSGDDLGAILHSTRDAAESPDRSRHMVRYGRRSITLALAVRALRERRPPRQIRSRAIPSLRWSGDVDDCAQVWNPVQLLSVHNLVGRRL